MFERMDQPKAKDEIIDPFEKLPLLITDLSKSMSAFRSKDKQGIHRLLDIVNSIESLCIHAPDAALAAIHLNKFESPLKQPLYSAILANLLAHRLEYSKAATKTLMCAVLTSNISFVEYQVLLNSANKPLTDHQKDKIHRHPYDSAELLRNASVDSEHWLKIIEQHHEKVDGSGYPNNLSGDEIEQDALIIALCEFYTAMIDNRAYRAPMKSRAALQALYEKSEDIEKHLHTAFIKVIGVYPPGSFVRLANNEIGVVFKRDAKSVIPIVKSIFAPDGEPYLGGILRDCNSPTFKIKSACLALKKTSLDIPKLWN